MKSAKPKNLVRLTAMLLLLGIAFLIHSCKKDITAKNDTLALSDPAVIAAKTWYENTYPVTMANSKQTNSFGNDPKDFTQKIKPDWRNSRSYKRFDKDVVEIPIDPSVKFQTALKTEDNRVAYKKEYSRVSFLLIKNASKYDAYVMTIIADSSYVKNDLSKLDHNKYNKRDSDFSGIVIYHTPKGQVVSGWMYKNGKLVKKLSVNGPQTTTSDKTIQSTHKSNTFVEICTGYFEYNYVVDTDLFFDFGWIATGCQYINVGVGGGGSTPPSGAGGGGSGNGDGNNNNNNNPPNPCAPAGPNLNSIKSGNKQINGAVTPDPHGGGSGPVDPGDDGFPAPNDPSDPDPCGQSNTNTIQVDSIKKNFPCFTIYILAQLQNSNSYNNFIQPFIGTAKPNLTWLNGNLPWNIKLPKSSSSVYQLGNTQSLNSTYSATVTLNTSMLQNSSQLLIAATTIHESIHAYINYNLKMAGYDVEDNNISVGSWLYGIDSWYSINGLPSNYKDHYMMMDSYFDMAVQALSAWDNNSHSVDDYRMAMLYGLNNSGNDATSEQAARLANEYNSLIQKYGFSASQLDTFYRSQLNANSNRLPQNCNNN